MSSADEVRQNELDLATIRALRSGEIDANTGWTDLIGRHRSRLFSLAYRFTGSCQDAEELTHEIIVRVFQQLHRFDPRAHFAVWLHSVARNYCIDNYRSRSRDRARIRGLEVPLEEALRSQRPDPQFLYEQGEARSDLLAALEGLSPKLREIIVLRFFREMPYEEICSRLGIPEGTVKSRIHRGRAELKRQLVAVRVDRSARRLAASGRDQTRSPN